MKSISAAELNAIVAAENAQRAIDGEGPLPDKGLPANTLDEKLYFSTVWKEYEYLRGDVVVTVYTTGACRVYYAPIGDTVEFLPCHKQYAFDYASGRRGHLQYAANGGDSRMRF